MILSVVNQKGGVGKTTTAINLAAYWAESGKRTLLVDMDPQGHATKGLGIRLDVDTPTVFQIIAAGDEPKPVPVLHGNLHVWPGDRDMADLDRRLGDNPGKPYRLRRALDEWAGDYDRIVIDCPPHLGAQTINALTASTHYLVPTAPGYFSIDGMAALQETVAEIIEYTNSRLQMLGIVLTQANERTNLTKETVDFLRASFGLRMLQTLIPHAVVVAESPGQGLPVFLYQPKSKAAEAYVALGHEIDALQFPEGEVGAN